SPGVRLTRTVRSAKIQVSKKVRFFARRPQMPEPRPVHPAMQPVSLNDRAACGADCHTAGTMESVLRWDVAAVETLFNLPFNDLVFRAHTMHRAHFDPNAVQLSTLISVKTGGCPEDCAYCPQAARHQTGVANQDILSLEQVKAAAHIAKASGATRFC